MRALYKITSNETGTIFLRRRKIAKALRWWLRENGFTHTYTYFSIKSHPQIGRKNSSANMKHITKDKLC
ncbi:MAG: hypothetical protein ABSF81_14970 [Bacteroidales bacterium]|jgi:hypothetical protein